MAKSFNAEMSVRFRKITADYQKINGYVHETAMMIARHAEEHNDCSTAQGLINAMPQSARKRALIEWFTTYTPIVVKDDAKWQSKMRKKEDPLYKPFDLDAGDANPWYTLAEGFGAEKPPAAFGDMVQWLEKQANAWEKKAADPTKVEEGEAQTALALAAQLRAIKLVHVAADNDEEPVKLAIAG